MGESVIESITSGEDGEPDPPDDALVMLAGPDTASEVDAEIEDDDYTLRLRRVHATVATVRITRE
jgi:hypothetical protein